MTYTALCGLVLRWRWHILLCMDLFCAIDDIYCMCGLVLRYGWHILLCVDLFCAIDDIYCFVLTCSALEMTYTSLCGLVLCYRWHILLCLDLMSFRRHGKGWQGAANQSTLNMDILLCFPPPLLSPPPLVSLFFLGRGKRAHQGTTREAGSSRNKNM
jgi:hypothetical protein